jgi:hypothetical protein
MTKRESKTRHEDGVERKRRRSTPLKKHCAECGEGWCAEAGSEHF